MILVNVLRIYLHCEDYINFFIFRRMAVEAKFGIELEVMIKWQNLELGWKR